MRLDSAKEPLQDRKFFKSGENCCKTMLHVHKKCYPWVFYAPNQIRWLDTRLIIPCSGESMMKTEDMLNNHGHRFIPFNTMEYEIIEATPWLSDIFALSSIAKARASLPDMSICLSWDIQQTWHHRFNLVLTTQSLINCYYVSKL
jgi:hypothetical protein